MHLKRLSYRTLILSCWLFLLNSGLGYAQFNGAGLSLNIDSLSGFDEEAATQSALAEQFTGKEFVTRMNQLKRAYVHAKYNLGPHSPDAGRPLPVNQAMASSAINEDFESSIPGSITNSLQIQGWTIVSGTHQAVNGQNSCNLLGCCPQNPSESAIIAVPAQGYVDYNIGAQVPILSVFGGNGLYGGTKLLRLGSSTSNAGIEQAGITFSVNANDSLFYYAMLSVHSVGHNCCDAGTVKVRLMDLTTNSLVANHTASVSGISNTCNNPNLCATFSNCISGTPASVNSGNVYSNMRVNRIDLSLYTGHTLYMEFTASDCTSGGHFSYAYIDTKSIQKGNPILNTMNVQFNGQYQSVAGNTMSLLSCGNLATLTLLDPFAYYSLGGQGTFTVNSMLITNPTGIQLYKIAGETTCYSNGLALPCCTINVDFYQGPTITSSDTLLCRGQSATLTASGDHGFQWSNGSNTSTIVITPNESTIYSVYSTTKEGCSGGPTYFTQQVVECTGLPYASANAASVHVFPNPVKDNLTITVEHPELPILLQLFDVRGSLILEKEIPERDSTVDLHQVAPGFYQARVLAKNGTIYVQKLLVQ